MKNILNEWNLPKIITTFEGEFHIFLKIFRACFRGGYIRMYNLFHAGGSKIFVEMCCFN